MKIKIIVISIVLNLGFLSAQDYVYYTQYMFNGLTINPAYAGSQNLINITGNIREQWVGMEGAPATQTLSAHAPVYHNQFGLGLSIINDHIGVSNQQEISAHYSYKIRIPGHVLGLGLKMGINSFNRYYDKLQIDDDFDSNFQKDKTTFQPIFGIGAYLKSDEYYAGISIPVLYKPKAMYYESKLNKLVFLTGGYVFHINQEVDIKPSILSKFNFGSTFEMDINANVYYRDFISFGLSYRSLNSVAFLFEIGHNNMYYLGYSYDLPTTSLIRYQGGTHEISFNVFINRDVRKKVINPRYF